MRKKESGELSGAAEVPRHLSEASCNLHLALLHLAAVEEEVGQKSLALIRRLVAVAIDQVGALRRNKVR
ncbi:MAG TPA: hypothetical protein VF449_01710 [Parvibaculum sp.]